MPSTIHRLRNLMVDVAHVKDPLQAYIIPSGDAHQSEYVAPCDMRRAFVSGFKGSAGTVVITKDKAALWTDGRYFTQAEKELDHHVKLVKEGVPDAVTIPAWLTEVFPHGGNVGIDPMLISGARWDELEHDLSVADFHLVAVEENLVDLVWSDQPHSPVNPVFILPIEYSGKLWTEKIFEVRQQMRENGAGMLVVTALDEIAWLFNLRGSDIEYNPVFFSYVILTLTTVMWFVNSKKVPPDVASYVHSAIDSSYVVAHHPYHHVKKHLLHEIKTVEGKVWNRRCLNDESPIAMMKAIKNPTEISGMRLAHIKDAVALCEFWAWMEQEVPKGEVTEVTATVQLLQFLRQQPDFMGLSFGTISQFGANSASPHYEPSAESDRTLTTKDIYLCDSGSQFRDGTTDITRTTHFGTPTAFQKECFTAVLKGHIALACTVFPPFTKGQMVDSLARAALWELGLDFLHATGHGVGSYLCVHEGPPYISSRHHSDDPGLQAGMTLTNEPGYYEEGKFGIRIETVMLVKKVKTKYQIVEDEDYLGFEMLSLVPIQKKMIDRTMLNKEEIEWLNTYHRLCSDTVGPVLESEGRNQAHQWLIKETEPIT